MFLKGKRKTRVLYPCLGFDAAHFVVSFVLYALGLLRLLLVGSERSALWITPVYKVGGKRGVSVQLPAGGASGLTRVRKLIPMPLSAGKRPLTQGAPQKWLVINES